VLNFAIVRCCIYLTTYDWIQSFPKIKIELRKQRAIYGNLENKINTLYWPEENPIHRNNMETIDKRTVTKRCRRKITEGQWAVLNFV
jgi:hypothetical protein